MIKYYFLLLLASADEFLECMQDNKKYCLNNFDFTNGICCDLSDESEDCTSNQICSTVDSLENNILKLMGRPADPINCPNTPETSYIDIRYSNQLY